MIQSFKAMVRVQSYINDHRKQKTLQFSSQTPQGHKNLSNSLSRRTNQAMASSAEHRAMALCLAIFVTLQLQVSMAAVYKVGDSAGWTTIGNVDYKNWAATKTFHVGDLILFAYNPQFHNVMQVTHADYKACNATTPIATHTTGNDTITITARGHHFFLCGVPGHCQTGQKVDINVPRTLLVQAPSGSPSSLSTTTTTVPAPSPSSTAPLYALMGLLGKLGLSMVVFAAFVSGFA
ncbi:hypothetical protein TEA_013672 [Camellia sinensis var. sinensis]|uniref:Phytocyanin domain-containing protein n=1 Tax=Camellia sinensis var. sinensis TaxID=542762 RepID=A0A4V3WLL5_CAMSN|nr:hypothetical protein TEA_013672 [Camellia sinensis var. sinensis]